MTTVDTFAINLDAWSEPEIGASIKELINSVELGDQPAVVAQSIISILDAYGYDSIDREISFTLLSQRTGWDYELIYNAWMALPNGGFAR